MNSTIPYHYNKILLLVHIPARTFTACFFHIFSKLRLHLFLGEKFLKQNIIYIPNLPMYTRYLTDFITLIMFDTE
jgi:hypothetical protein